MQASKLFGTAADRLAAMGDEFMKTSGLNESGYVSRRQGWTLHKSRRSLDAPLPWDAEGNLPDRVTGWPCPAPNQE